MYVPLLFVNALNLAVLNVVYSSAFCSDIRCIVYINMLVCRMLFVFPRVNKRFVKILSGSHKRVEGVLFFILMYSE